MLFNRYFISSFLHTHSSVLQTSKKYFPFTDSHRCTQMQIRKPCVINQYQVKHRGNLKYILVFSV